MVLHRLARIFLAASLGSLGCAQSRTEPSAAASARAAPVASAPPSPSAEPDTVSQASPAYDGGAPVEPSSAKVVDGAKLRARHIARLESDRSPVTVLTGESALELGQRLCESVVPRREPGVPVLVKPNLCGFDGFKVVSKPGGDDGVAGRVTDAEFTRGVVRCLKARGHRRIVVADGCGNSHEHWLRAVELSGYARMTAEEQVPLVALDDDGVFDKTGDQPGKPLRVSGLEKTHVPTLLMPKLLAEALETGLFVSVPKIKAHRYSVVSLGIKGMQGTVMRSEATPAYNQKWRMHEELKAYLGRRKRGEPEDRAQYVASLEAFAERMVDVLELSLPDAVLAEGVPAMAGDGFQTLRRVPGGVAIGGTNPVLVDRVGAEYLGLWNNAELAQQLGGHRTSPLIELAARRYGVPLAKPELIGDGALSLKKPRATFFKALAPFTIPPAPAAAEAPTAHARRVTASPQIDGKLEPAWLETPAISWQTDYSGADTGIRTTARFLWADSALFALFELEGTGSNTDTSRPVALERDKLYQEDCVELFLAPSASQPSRYFEVELGPFGHFFDLEIGGYGKVSKSEWSSKLTIAVARNEAARTAIVEARIASADVTSALAAGARLPLALYRMEGKAPRNYLAWRPARTPKPNFHLAEGFGTLIIDP
ncbi:MAG: DUF362 domain-containing protein [Myxococcales bacterium]|nr:MAG: DUF362 domain-containing protein [Myxococcales bacterium]